jgi:type II secretory pathway predicted ATPase ExeA
MKKISIFAIGPLLIASAANKAVQQEEIHMKLLRPSGDFFALPIFTYIILGALAVLVLLVIVWFFYRWWRSGYSYCTWCGARNQKDWEFCTKCGARLKAPSLNKSQKDWLSSFGWKSNPFTLDVVLGRLAGRQAEISLITNKLNTLSGHILIIGGVGTGKTMLLRWLERSLKGSYETIYIPLPYTRPAQLIDLIASSITKPLVRMRRYTLHDLKDLCARSRKRVVLLLDDMHELTAPYVELLNTLGNLPNVSLVMGGRPEVREGLKHNMPELFNHIVESVLLVALTRAETEELIRERINYVGGKKTGPFSPQAIDEIHIVSLGIPRNILKICDWAVAQAMNSGDTELGAAEIQDYVRQIKQARPHTAGKEG